MNFEAWYQSGKVFKGVDERKSKAWWLALKTPKRSNPSFKGKKVLYCDWGNGPLNYMESRVQVYVPEYHAHMASTDMAAHWLERVQRGENVVVYDFDGPRLPDGTPTYAKVTPDLLREKLYDERHPFGHGYVVAAHLAGIPVASYCF